MDKQIEKISGKDKYAFARDGAAIHLGGKHDADDLFLPEIYAEKPGWNDGTFMRLRHADAKKAKGEKAKLVKGRGKNPDLDAVEWKLGGRTHHFIQGSVEHTITYDSPGDVPADGIEGYEVEFPANALEWHLQPALTAEEIEAGCIRTENVVGSYAVYGRHAHNLVGPDGTPISEYETGKFCHVYPWWLVDAMGQRVKVPITFDAVTGRLWGQLPLDFVVSANYPLMLDPAFGYETAGASSATVINTTHQYANKKAALLYTASAGDAINKLWAYVWADSGGVGHIATYTIVSGEPSAKGTDKALTLTGTPAWVYNTLIQSLAAGTTYTIGYGNAADDVDVTYIAYDSGSAGDAAYRYAALTDPFGAVTNQNRIYSLFAGYSAAPIPFDPALLVQHPSMMHPIFREPFIHSSPFPVDILTDFGKCR